MSEHGDKPSRLSVFGDGMMNKLPSTTRKRRKRGASKKRRGLERSELRTRQYETGR